MICKKTNLMALCEELATPVTQDGEFLLKGGFGSFGGGISPRITNQDCLNIACKNAWGCTNVVCVNGECINSAHGEKECTNQICRNTTAKPEPTDVPTKEEDKAIQCGFLF